MQLDGDSGIEITINYHTLGSVVNISPRTYQVDFTVDDSLASTLGFDAVTLTYDRGHQVQSGPVWVLFTYTRKLFLTFTILLATKFVLALLVYCDLYNLYA